MHIIHVFKDYWKIVLCLSLKSLLIVEATSHVEDEEEIKGIEETPIKPVSVLVGTRVVLPCQVASQIPEDKPILVLFYKRKLTTPVYSLDARDGPLSLGKKWVALDVFGSRARFDLRSPVTGLIVDPVIPEDTGLYRCRVDFKASPTRNERIMLEVVAPPDRVYITNDAGLEVSGLIGPYNLGATITLACNVQGGYPIPKITWRKRVNGVPSSSSIISNTLGTLSNTLILKQLTRDDLYSVVTCIVNNSKLTPPLSTSVTLDITFPPLEVNLLNTNISFREKEEANTVCEAVGSRPAANITWWKNSIRIDKVTSEVLDKGNITKSTLTFIPEISDDGAQLVCRARNPIVPMAVIETSTKIKVLYSPRLKLLAGRSLNMADIKEGDDVYFECEILANPKAHTVKWFLKGEELFHKISSGVILSNQSLVLQKVRKSYAGDYQCTAFNTEGVGQSNLLNLLVKYVPLCDTTRLQSYGVEHNETIHVSCNSKANPEPRQYRWAFNTSSELLDLSWVKGQTKKQLIYTPKSDLDYGSLLCWAENEIGLQETPCVYHVIKSSVPGPLKNCSVKNVTSTSAYIFCQSGWNGGLEQYFTLNVLNGSLPGDKQRLEVANNFPVEGSFKRRDKISEGDRATVPGEGLEGFAGESPRPLAKAAPAPRPNFYLTGLKPNTNYVISVTANNRKGKSRPTKILIFTQGDAAEKRVGLSKESSLTEEYSYIPLAIFSSSLALLLLIFLIVVIVLRSKRGPTYVSSAKGVTLNFAQERKVKDDPRGHEDLKQCPEGTSTMNTDPVDSQERSTSSTAFHQLKFNFEKSEEDSEEFYVVKSYSPQELKVSLFGERDQEYKMILPGNSKEKSGEMDRGTMFKNGSQVNESEDSYQANTVSENVPLALSDSLSECIISDCEPSVYSKNILVLSPSACEPSRTDLKAKDHHYTVGLSESQVGLPNLEKFLNESQLESAV